MKKLLGDTSSQEWPSGCHSRSQKVMAEIIGLSQNTYPGSTHCLLFNKGLSLSLLFDDHLQDSFKQTQRIPRLCGTHQNHVVASFGLFATFSFVSKQLLLYTMSTDTTWSKCTYCRTYSGHPRRICWAVQSISYPHEFFVSCIHPVSVVDGMLWLPKNKSNDNRMMKW